MTASQQADELIGKQRSHRHGDDYLVSATDKESFDRDGYVHLEGVLSEDERAGSPTRTTTTSPCSSRSTG